MSQRILAVILAVTASAMTAFGIPLGVAVQRIYRDQEVLRLEREATLASAGVSMSSLSTGDPVELLSPAGPTVIALYDVSGRRLLGQGPDRADSPVRSAMGGSLSDGSAAGTVVVAVPLSHDEAVFAVVRASVADSVIAIRVRRAWLAMVATASVVLIAAAIAARWQAQRLTRPIESLTSATTRLGEGDFAVRARRCGIPELDAAAAAIDVTAERLGRLLSRERAFSADASHQLRTPLTGLRLRLEQLSSSPDVDAHQALDDSLREVDRLEATIDDLLALARDVGPDRGILDVTAVVGDVEQAWHGRLAAAGRPLRAVIGAGLPAVAASSAAVRQILEVLLSNAAEHGTGTVTLSAQPTSGGVVLEVTDEGPGVRGDPERAFRRRSDGVSGRGLGLALARSLAEAEGARLLLRASGPTPTFRLVMARRPGAATADEQGDEPPDAHGTNSVSARRS